MTKVIIVGGGVIGLASALVLSKHDLAVTVLDKNTFVQPTMNNIDPRVYAINPRSQALLQQIKAWPAIKKRAQPFEAMHVWDNSNNQAIDFNCRDTASLALGHIIEESVIKAALLEQIEQSNIELIGNCELTHLQTSDGIKIQSNDKQWHADFLIAADGANSWCRQQLAIAMTTWDYNHHAIISHVKCEKNHQNTAWQVFTREGTLAMLPLNDKQHCSIVWSTIPDKAQELMKLEPQAFNEQLGQTFEHKLGHIIGSQQRYSFALKMRHVKQYVGSNWLILGDAAHTIHPLAGQGMNLGFADITALSELIKTIGDTGCRKTELQRFQRSRKSDAWKLIAAMEGFKQLFSADYLPGFSTIRGWGIQSLNRLQPVKQLLIQLAS